MTSSYQTEYDYWKYSMWKYYKGKWKKYNQGIRTISGRKKFSMIVYTRRIQDLFRKRWWYREITHVYMDADIECKRHGPFLTKEDAEAFVRVMEL